MNNDVIHFVFAERVSMDEVAKTLELARMACEALHGPERVALKATSVCHSEDRRVSITGLTPTGRDLAAMFLGYARREYGASAVDVHSPSSALKGGQRS